MNATNQPRDTKGRFIKYVVKEQPLSDVPVLTATGSGDTGDVLAHVRAELKELAERFNRHGHRLYLVGGIVRDAEAGVPFGGDFDLDMTTDAEPEKIKSLLGGWADDLWTQGERFGTIAANRAGRRIEITTHRSEHYDPDSRKPEVRFSGSLRSDLSRRDFTINAMAIELPDGALFDPFGGADDLSDRVLRTPRNSLDTFKDDPLRMLRAARFLSRFDMTADNDLIAAMKETKNRLSIVAHERIREELDKLLALPSPDPAFRLLFKTGLADHVIGPVGDTTTALKRLEQAGADPMARLAALVACGGSVKEIRKALSIRRATGATMSAVTTILVSAHHALQNPPDDLPALRRWVLSTGRHVEQTINVAATLGDIRNLRSECERLLADELDLYGPPVLDGKAIMAILKIKPGPEVGAAVRELQSRRLDYGPLTRKEARKHLKQWHRNRQRI